VRADQFQRMLDMTADALINCLSNQMPDGLYREFYAWGFSRENPVRDAWLQTTGLTQLVKLTVNLYEGLAPESDMPRLVEYCIPVNIYQIYEIVSDNLAIGLAHLAPDDHTFTERRNLVLEFNRAMDIRLQNPSTSARDLFTPAKPLIEGISSATQSLSPHKHMGLMQTYLNVRHPPSTKELEYAIWPLLVANIEACADMVKFTKPYRLGTMIQHGLIQRYRGVTGLLENRHLELSQRLDLSTNAILVAPIVANFISGLCEEVNPAHNFQSVIQNNTLPEALYLVALLIRLLNDLGTGLIIQSPEERRAFFDELRRRAAPGETITSLMRAAVQERGALLTRIDKDVRHGEFNLAFFDLYSMPSVMDALNTFENRINDYAKLYHESRRRLMTLLEAMSLTLKDERAGAIIHRCLVFHERLYAHSFEEAEGEYAV
jgi:hypothetical protein